MKTERVPVLVVGAGLSGLSAAMFLGVHGIRSMVVERHATTSTEQRWVELIRIACGVPDLEPTLVEGGGATTYTAVRVADRFSLGRVHLIGDAVRVMPPTGGMGGNTAILDGYHLAWKLAMVLRGEAGSGLLDSHDPERRPYAELLVEQQYTAYVHRMRPDLADGTLAAPVEPVSALFFGYRHLSDAVLVEPGDDRETLENPELPTGRPGSRAPHVWLDRDGHRVSTVELFGRRFVLLVGPAGDGWVQDGMLAGAALGITLDFHRIGPRCVRCGWSMGGGIRGDRRGRRAGSPGRVRRLALARRRHTRRGGARAPGRAGPPRSRMTHLRGGPTLLRGWDTCLRRWATRRAGGSPVCG